MTVSLIESFQIFPPGTLNLVVNRFQFDFDNAARLEPKLIVVHRNALGGAQRLTYTSTTPPVGPDEYTIKDYVPATKLGTVEISDAMLINDSVLVQRDSPLDQDTSYAVSGRFPSAAAEDLADLHTKRAQEGVPLTFRSVGKIVIPPFPTPPVNVIIDPLWAGIEVRRQGDYVVTLRAALAAAGGNGIQGIEASVHVGANGDETDAAFPFYNQTINTALEAVHFENMISTSIVVSANLGDLISISAKNAKTAGGGGVSVSIQFGPYLEIVELQSYGLIQETHT